MSIIAKLAVIVAVITTAPSATVSSSLSDLTSASWSLRAQVFPLEIMRTVGALPEIEIQSYEGVFPVL